MTTLFMCHLIQFKAASKKTIFMSVGKRICDVFRKRKYRCSRHTSELDNADIHMQKVWYSKKKEMRETLRYYVRRPNKHTKPSKKAKKKKANQTY
jgi:hypothetical protein